MTMKNSPEVESLINEESACRRNRMLGARDALLSLTSLERRTVVLSLDSDTEAIREYCADIHAQNIAIG